MGRLKGSGSFFTKSGVIYWVVKINGSRKTIRLNATDIPSAEKEIKKYLLAKDVTTQEEVALFAGRARKILETVEKLDFQTAWENYVRSPSRNECGESLLKHKEYVWNRFSAYAMSKDIKYPEDVPLELFSDWLAQLKLTKKPKTVNTYAGMVKLVYNSLKIKHNFAEIKKLPVNPVCMKDFTGDELKEVFAAVDTGGIYIMDREQMSVLFRIGAYTGLRLKDAVLLRWEHIDLRRELINCTPHKTRNSSGKTVWVPIHHDLRVLLEYAGKWGHGYVLPDLAKRYLKNCSSLTHSVSRILNWAMWKDRVPGKRPPKVGKYGFHSFRHTFVSFCANAGVPLAFVQEVVGHTSQVITRHYTHLSPDALRQVVSALPSFAS